MSLKKMGEDTMNQITKKHSVIFVKNKNIFECAKNRLFAKENSSTIIIPHVCNNINAFGAGFASQVAEEFPSVKMNFHMLGNTAKLGHVQYVSVAKNSVHRHELIFANMIAQNKLLSQNNPRPLNYAALVYAMNDVRNHIQRIKQSNSEIDNIEIHAPKFGSGLAGGDWSFIMNLIDDIWNNIPVYVYALGKQ